MNSNSYSCPKKGLTPINRETRQTHERGSCDKSPPSPPLGERAGVRWLPFPLPSLFLFVCFACFAVSARAATFTTNALITEANSLFDGQDIVVSGATLTVDGRHSFNSLLLTNGAVLTHSLCTTTNTHKLDLVVTNEVVLSTNSRIAVSRFRPLMA